YNSWMAIGRSPQAENRKSSMKPAAAERGWSQSTILNHCEIRLGRPTGMADVLRLRLHAKDGNPGSDSLRTADVHTQRHRSKVNELGYLFHARSRRHDHRNSRRRRPYGDRIWPGGPFRAHNAV